MRKLVLAALSLVVAVGFTIAAEVTFVKYDDGKLTVKEGDKEVTVKVTDKTTFKFGDMPAKDAEKAKASLAKMKEGKKFNLTYDKDVATEIAFPAPKKKDKAE